MTQSNPGFIQSSGPNSTAIPKVQNIFGVSEDFLGQLKTWLEQNPPSVPITSILGFSQFTVQSATKINTSESTTSATYTDLTTVGPTLSGLSNGKYLVLYGASLNAATGKIPFMNISENGSTPADDNNAVNGSDTTVGVSGATGYLTTLSSGNNTLKAVYRSNTAGSTASFNKRWLIAIKYANS